MSLEQRINGAIKESMIAKDQTTLRGLRAIKSAIMLAKTEPGADGNVSEEKEIQILQKMMKQRQDASTLYKEQGRADLAEKEDEEIAVIKDFLPAQMSEEEIKSVVSDLIQKLGAEGMKDMGKVMGAAREQFAGKADNKTVASIIKEALSA